MRIVPNSKTELWNLGLRPQSKDRKILHHYITVSKWDPKECWAIIPANDCLLHNIQLGWMFVLFPSDTYWGHEIHYTDCFSSRIFKAQRIVNMEKELFSLSSVTHENSHFCFCNNCTTDNLQSYIVQSGTFHLLQVLMQNNFRWKLCLYYDLKYLVSRSAYSLCT